VNIHTVVKSIRFFNLLNNEQINYLSEISIVRSFSEDTIIYYESDIDYSLQFLVSGLVKIYKVDKYNNEIFLYYITKNSIISEISTINENLLNTYSNIAFLEKSQVLSIDFKLFKDMFLDKNILNKEFINEIIIRSKNLESLINREFIFDAVTKVAAMLGSNLDMFNKLKRNDIAMILHIQPATLSRVLNRLKKNKIINIMQGKISILDYKNLKLIYEELVR